MSFNKLVSHPVRFRLFLLKNLPSAFFSGVRVQSIDGIRSVVTLPYKWFTRNPFRSTYFACLSMAGEMASGVLALSFIFGRKPSVAMLVLSIEGKFHKKAVGLTRFVCSEGKHIEEAIGKAIQEQQAQTVRALSAGYNEAGDLVAEFWITWSFKARN